MYPAFELGANTSYFSDNQQDGVANLSVIINLQDFWRGAVYNDSDWTPESFSTTLMDLAIAADPGHVNAWDLDLSEFRSHGGRIISYHGRNDEVNSLSHIGHYLLTG